MPASPRRLPLLLLLAVASAPTAAAQTATLRGFVTDATSGEALPSVNVLAAPVTDAAADPFGAATTVDGLYTITRLPAGRYAVRASFVGYEPFADTLALEGGEIRQLNIELAPASEELGEVTVESERTAGAARITAGLQRIDPADIELVPTPDVSGDLVNYLTTLPGVVTTGDRGGQLFIRGGEPSQNEVLLDGIPVYQPFHLLGFYSAFPNAILNRADVYAGGYSARYGGRLSSVIDVATRNGNKRRFAGSASVAPFVSALSVEGPLVQDRLSVLGSARVSTVEQGASRLVDQPLPFDFGDAFGKVHLNVTDASQLSLSGVYTYDRGTLGTDVGASEVGGTSPQELRYSNLGIGGRYLLLPKTVPVLAEVLVSVAQFETELGAEGAAARSSSVGRIGGSANISYFLGAFNLRAGAFVRTTSVESELGGLGGEELFQNVDQDRQFVTEAGAYAEPEFALGGVKLTPGLHFAASPNQGTTFIEPRLRAVWDVGVHQLSAAAGLYHQEIVGLNDRRDATSSFTAWTVTPGGASPRALHAVAGYRITPVPTLDLAVEGFYKRIDDLQVGEWTAFPRLTTNLQPATGEVLGLDARVEFRRGNFFTTVNYGLSSVEYEAEGRNLELWYGTETLRFRPPHDRRHQVNALVAYRVAGFDLSARWQFGSGLPYSQAVGFDQFIVPDGQPGWTTEAGAPRVIYESPYNAELPTYHRLDLSVERTFDVRAAEITAQAGLINVYDRRNLFYYDVFTLRRVDQLPLIPSFGLKVAFE